MKIIGWDIGGAHIKAAKIDFKKKESETKQIYSPIWKNTNNLKKCSKNGAESHAKNGPKEI